MICPHLSSVALQRSRRRGPIRDLMLVLKFETEIPLAEPNEDFGFITWLSITIREFDSKTPGPVGSARVAVIHCGDALNKGVSIHDVLDQDSEGLAVLDGVLF